MTDAVLTSRQATRLEPGATTEVSPRVREAQALLDAYFGGGYVRPDGKLGSTTRRFIERFQRAEALPGVVPGGLDDATMEALRARAAAGYRARIQVQTDAFAPETSAAVEARRRLIDQTIVNGGPRPPLPGAAIERAPEAPLPSHTVRTGETLVHIARDHDVTVDEIVRFNPGLNVHDLREGDPLFLPPRTHPREEALARREDGPSAPIGPWTDAPVDRPVLQRGRAGGEPNAAVEAVQRRLAGLGYSLGRSQDPDGRFGPGVQEAVRLFQAVNGVRSTGIVDTATWEKLAAGEARPASMVTSPGTRYPAGSPQQVELFRRAAALLRTRGVNVPDSWASSRALQNILLRENRDGEVGRPNYRYGARANDPATWPTIWAELRAGNIRGQAHVPRRLRSSATGLGQLLGSNVDKYYPSGRAGIGDAIEEAAGMMHYILASYRTPERAWANYNRRHQGY